MFGELSPLATPIGRSTIGPRFYYSRSRLSLFGRGARYFSTIRRQMLPWIVNQIKSAAKREGCQAILGVYPDEMYLQASYLAAEKLDIPFYSYFHNTYLDNIAVNPNRAREIQCRVFERSRRVFVMSEGMRSHFESEYQLTNCRTLPHTFERYPEQEIIPYQFPVDRPIKIVLFGNFNESNLDATKRFCTTLAAEPEVRLHLYSEVPRFLLEQRGLPMKSIEYHGSLGSLPLNPMIEELRKYDMLALTHGFIGGYGPIEYKTIFPTRTIPMLLSGRPLFVHSPPNCFLTKFAEANKIGLVVNEANPSTISSAFRRFRSDPRQAHHFVQNARAASSQFFGPNVVQGFKTEMHLSLKY